MEKCLTCQRIKEENQRHVDELQLVQILEWKWEEIAMDFVVGLPKTMKRYNAI